MAEPTVTSGGTSSGLHFGQRRPVALDVPNELRGKRMSVMGEQHKVWRVSLKHYRGDNQLLEPQSVT